ncbi:MAG: hypothetical protein M2R45_04171 [Verrucomicrobia subdivision 3 bacterium]|nr:hypothetical protein [Limisphaerales bacterium]MCS1413024.1 hypothetical protein [Limisphaerales bacterium]
MNSKRPISAALNPESGFPAWFLPVGAFLFHRPALWLFRGGDGTGSTTATADDPGFANVGDIGVYLGSFSGNFWVLTAFHMKSGVISLNGFQL